MFKASPFKKFRKFISKKDGKTVVFIVIMLAAILFAVSKIFPTYRETTAQDYLYYEADRGFLYIGSNTGYEIGSIKNHQKNNKRMGGVASSAEYNKLDDSIYVLQETGCSVNVIARDGRTSALDYSRLKGCVSATSIFFDKKNYKYLTLNGGTIKKPFNAIVIFNDKQEIIKVIKTEFDVDSMVILNDKLVYSQADMREDQEPARYLTTYDLKTNKSITVDYSKKNKNLFNIGTLMQLDNDYLISYHGNDDFNYVITSKGKVLNKSTKIIGAYNPSHHIDNKWYLDIYLAYEKKGEDKVLVEYTKDSFKKIGYLNTCDYYNDLIFNNKGIYCVSKKDNKKIISVLDNDKNVYKLDKKYVYGTYHRLALFGFK